MTDLPADVLTPDASPAEQLRGALGGLERMRALAAKMADEDTPEWTAWDCVAINLESASRCILDAIRIRHARLEKERGK
jgi:hypothetical protein